MLDTDPAIVSFGPMAPPPPGPMATTQYNQPLVPTSQHLVLNYTLNPMFQAKRLLDNAQKPPMSVTLNDIKVINGENHPTNAFIECNAGTYLSALKPALEAVSVGWKSEIKGVTLACDDVSDRKDSSGRMVHTKLILILSEKSSIRGKVVLHFYHTSNTIQVQGSTIMSEGISSAAWLVKNFIEPLAYAHIRANNETISAINNDIINGNQASCGFCGDIMNPAATLPKDKALPCDNCGKLFHKRCTNRRNGTNNWQKKPWFCQSCILTEHNKMGPSSRADTNLLSDTNDNLNNADDLRLLTLNPAASEFIPQQHSQPTASQHSQPTASQHSQPTASQHPKATAPPPNNPDEHFRSAPKFPSNSIRQRSSNINVTNAEIEFQNTALNSCRSTIIQQEMELKRLNETLSIRNRRIMQLEDQIKHAGDCIASRDVGTSHNSSSSVSIGEKLIQISAKIDSLQISSPPSNNIFISSSGARNLKTQHSQTDLLQCGKCDQIDVSTADQTPKTNDFPCKSCDETFSNRTILQEHIAENHKGGLVDSEEFTCDYCGIFNINENDLQAHIENNHLITESCPSPPNIPCSSTISSPPPPPRPSVQDSIL